MRGEGHLTPWSNEGGGSSDPWGSKMGKVELRGRGGADLPHLHNLGKPYDIGFWALLGGAPRGSDEGGGGI